MRRSTALKLIGVGVAVWVFFPFFIYEWPETWSMEGFAHVIAERIGWAFAPIAFGAIGFIYRPNPYLGWIVGIIIVTSGMIEYGGV